MQPHALQARIRAVPDFPKPGVLFRDITPLLADAEALRCSGRLLADPFRGLGVDVVLGIESRGFIFGPLVAHELDAGFVPVRKPGKLPSEVVREQYDLEYGKDAVEIHADAVRRGQVTLIVDDVIATGGTAAATCRLAERLGANVCGLSFLIEIEALAGRGKLVGRNVQSIIRF